MILRAMIKLRNQGLNEKSAFPYTKNENRKKEHIYKEKYQGPTATEHPPN